MKKDLLLEIISLKAHLLMSAEKRKTKDPIYLESQVKKI